MLEKPKVSVIVPVYKAEAYLYRCVDSLLAVSYTHLTQRQAMLLILTIACLFSGVNICLISYIDNNILIFFDILVWVGLNLWLSLIHI